jgi:hypothetical protein
MTSTGDALELFGFQHVLDRRMCAFAHEFELERFRIKKGGISLSL